MKTPVFRIRLDHESRVHLSHLAASLHISDAKYGRYLLNFALFEAHARRERQCEYVPDGFESTMDRHAQAIQELLALEKHNARFQPKLPGGLSGDDYRKLIISGGK